MSLEGDAVADAPAAGGATDGATIEGSGLAARADVPTTADAGVTTGAHAGVASEATGVDVGTVAGSTEVPVDDPSARPRSARPQSTPAVPPGAQVAGGTGGSRDGDVQADVVHGGVKSGGAQNGAGQYSAAQSSAVQSSAVQSSAVQSSAVQSSAAPNSAAQSSAAGTSGGQSPVPSPGTESDNAAAARIAAAAAPAGGAPEATTTAAGGSVAAAGAQVFAVNPLVPPLQQAVPVPVLTPSASVAQPPPTAPHVPAPPGLPDQLVPRIASVRALGDGVHRLTLRVEPEAIGAVRVVAEVRGDEVRLQLFGGTEAAREALRAALPDLRRDLASSGLQAQLDLGTSGDRQPGQRTSRSDAGDQRHERETGPSLSGSAATHARMPRHDAGRLDVLA